jgi:hypothetical protein
LIFRVRISSIKFNRIPEARKARRSAMISMARTLCPNDLVIAPRYATGRMINAACKAMTPSNRPGQSWISNKAKHRWRYRKMIEAGELRG